MALWTRTKELVDKIAPLQPEMHHPVEPQAPAVPPTPEPDTSDAELSFIVAQGDLEKMAGENHTDTNGEETALIDIRHHDIMERAAAQLAEKESGLISQISRALDDLRRTQLTRLAYEAGAEYISAHASDSFSQDNLLQQDFDALKARGPKQKAVAGPDKAPVVDLNEQTES